MKVVKAEIDWMRGWGNSPDLKVWVDRIAKWEDRVYHRKVFPGGDASYWCNVPDTPFVTFFHHNPRNERGYGGSVFAGKLVDGTEFSVRGPWSSNSMDMNQYFPMTTGVTLYETEGDYPGLGYGGWAMKSEEFGRLVRTAGGELALIKGYGGRDNEVDINDPAARDVWNKLAVGALPVGRYDWAIKLPGMTLAESQEKKNEGWICGRKEV